MVDKPFIIPQPIQPVGKPAVPRQTPAGVKTPFNQVLQEELQKGEELKFSRHAQERLDLRKIKITPHHLERLNAAVQKAQAKGARESLVLIDDLAFVVSIKNKTVITAVDGESRKENVFTNIDSAVIM